MKAGFFPNRLVTFVVLTAIVAGFFSYSPIHAQISPEERAQLESDLLDLENQIAQNEALIEQYRKQGTSLKGEISSLNAKIDKINLQIKAVTLSLTRLSSEIVTNQQQVTAMQQKLDRSRLAMMDALQAMNEQEQVSLITILLNNPNLTNFFADINNLLAIQDTLTETIQEVNNLKDELLDAQEDLVAKKSETLALKELQDRQRQNAVSTKQEKDNLLVQTKGKESEFQKLAAQKRAEAAKIRSRIFELLGGGEMTFEEAYDLAKTAEKATGVSAAFLLAVLDRESGLGRNVGKCSYKTAMSPGIPRTGKRDDITPFLKITAELGLDPEKTLVSCAIKVDGAFGGAMGAAQFIPTTWMLFRDRISAITGHNPPSPWVNSDAFVGTALYLKDAMNACTGPIYGSGGGQIKCAAARYYAGGNWYKNSFLSTYGSATLARMNKFEDDIAAITAN